MTATIDGEHETWTTGLSQPRPRSCPAPARLWEVAFGASDWTDDERGHVADCARCREQLATIRRAEAGSLQSSELSVIDPTPQMSETGPALFGDAMPEVQQNFGHYQILRVVGRGGMGVVYEALDLQLNRRVALKAMRTPNGLDDHLLDRFQREARLLSRVDHPGIVPVYELGQFGEIAYLAMPFIEGQTLARFTRVQGTERLPIREAVRIVAEVADAVAHAHRRGLIHRDIKPSNILLRTDGRPLLTDFGLAHAPSEEEASLTCHGVVMGTPAYMSPEQARGDFRGIDARADIYSLGATLFALLAGRTPHHVGGSPVETLRRLIEEEPTPVRSLNRAVDRDLEAICLRAMARDPDRRYATAADLAADLRRYLNREPIMACRLGLLALAWRWHRRHPAVLSHAVLIGLVLLLGSMVLRNRRPGPTMASFENPVRTSLLLSGSVDPEFTARHAEALDRLRRLRLDLGRHADLARTSGRSSEALLFASSHSADVDLNWAARHVEALNDLGRLYLDLGRPVDAVRAYRRSADLLERLAREHPDRPAYHRGLAEAQWALEALASRAPSR